jgi:hypothetical protein
VHGPVGASHPCQLPPPTPLLLPRPQDDIQGTAATAVAGLYGALRVLGRPHSDLAKQRVVCLGAGSAGMGVVGQIKDGARPGAEAWGPGPACCLQPRGQAGPVLQM